MPKKSELPLEHVHLRLYEGDSDILREFYPELGYNAVVRELVHKHCRRLLEKSARSSENNNVPTLDFSPDELSAITAGGGEPGEYFGTVPARPGHLDRG